MGISRECFFSALFAKAKALSKKIHSCVSGGNVEKTLLLCGIINKRTGEFLRELSFSFNDHTFQIGELSRPKTLIKVPCMSSETIEYE